MDTTITPDLTVNELAGRWVQKLRTNGRLESTTIDEYQRVLRTLVGPELGSKHLDEVTTEHVNKLLDDLGQRSRNRQRKAKVILGAMLDFAIVQGAFGWLVDNYPRLADWNASARRIASLMMSLDGLERAEQSDELGRIQHGETKGDAMLSLDDLSVTLDDGTSVVKETEVVVEPGERVLVSGESGSGKSTLVRAIAGLWPWGTGRIVLPASTRTMFVSRYPYVPPGTLRASVAYPVPATAYSDADLIAALGAQLIMGGHEPSTLGFGADSTLPVTEIQA